MLFQSLEFLLFFAPVFLFDWLSRSAAQPVRAELLLASASALFYLSRSVPLFSLLRA